MCPAQYDPDKNIDAAFTRAIQFLQKNQDFADAFYLGQMQLERSPTSEGKLAGFIKNAHESGLLDECAEFLVAFANRHPGDADLLNYTAGLLGGMGHHQQSRVFARMAAGRKPFFLRGERTPGCTYSPCSASPRGITDTLPPQSSFTCQD